MKLCNIHVILKPIIWLLASLPLEHMEEVEIDLFPIGKPLLKPPKYHKNKSMKDK
jgi:hypothetical protein